MDLFMSCFILSLGLLLWFGCNLCKSRKISLTIKEIVEIDEERGV
ncbi:MAG TPA: hypothetical protein PL110_09325 [Candidatus Eremiobacteraeota bacterium]|nr:MAG: hypothetical protein BWY64_00971 [bacterium ADurb.Bin363]HPZ08303.1 hypothetical protein [Candidatus Eremiobacteraeota bacterium]